MGSGTFGPTYGDNRESGGTNAGNLTNLGAVASIPNTDEVERLGYRLIGWTSDPTATTLASTSWGSSTHSIPDGFGGSTTVYEIDYRSGSNLSKPSFTMPTGLQSSLKMYAIWEPLPAVIHYRSGLTTTQDTAEGNIDAAGHYIMPDTTGVVGGTATVSNNMYKRKYYEFNNWKVRIGTTDYKYNGGDVYTFIATTISTIHVAGADVEGVEVTLTATWKPKKYTLEYVTLVGKPIAHKLNQGITSHNFDRSTKAVGANFLGWYTERNGAGIPIVDNSTTIADLNPNDDEVKYPDKVIEVYAKWESIRYRIMFDLDGGAWKTKYNPTKTNMLANKKVPVPSALKGPKKAGYTFGGWYVKRNGVGKKLGNNTYLSEYLGFNDKGPDFVFYAYWIPNASTSGSTSGGSTGGVSTGSAVILPQSATKIKVLDTSSSEEEKEDLESVKESSPVKLIDVSKVAYGFEDTAAPDTRTDATVITLIQRSMPSFVAANTECIKLETGVITEEPTADSIVPTISYLVAGAMKSGAKEVRSEASECVVDESISNELISTSNQLVIEEVDDNTPILLIPNTLVFQNTYMAAMQESTGKDADSDENDIA